jgi:hypothetical protein
MLRGLTDSTSSVAVFDGSILATAAVSAPEAMIKTVCAALHGFGDLPDEDREMLFERFGCGRTTMRPCTVRLRYLLATRTPSATGCVGSRNTPADPSRGQRILPNCVWLSRYTAVSCSRNPLTLWTSGEPPRGALLPWILRRDDCAVRSLLRRGVACGSQARTGSLSALGFARARNP